MAGEDYKDYLAARILSENRPVTYRLLSRAANVDVNSAKCMLFDFHQKQNAKKPKSVHATYLLAGTKRQVEQSNGQHDVDTMMRSSPFMSSMPEPEEAEEAPVKRTTIVLVREEELEKTRAQFDKESSIHIYSLQPGPIENVNILAACNHEVTTEHSGGDPMGRWKTYGSIQNSHVKRRTAKFAPPPASTAAKPAARPVAKSIANSTTTAKLQREASNTSNASRRGSVSEDNTSGRTTPQPSTSTSTLKRSDSKGGAAKKKQSAGDLFKSFAKAKPKAKEVEVAEPAEDDTMHGMSEDEGEGEDEPEVKVDEEKHEAARKAREERQEKLRKMMEDDDEDMPDAPTPKDEPEEATPPTPMQTTTEPPESEPTVVVEGGRRRGKRRVMKKKKVKDEEGYLVTREEAVWESFSEDEPEQKKLKPAPKPATGAKGKPAGKKGQGSIASFFRKA